MHLWRKYKHLRLGRSSQFGRSASTESDILSPGPPRKAKSHIGEDVNSRGPLYENNARMMEVERKARYHWLTLLIEWDKKDIIAELLKEVENDNYFGKKTLNNALQVALEHNRQAFLIRDSCLLFRTGG